MTARRRPLNGVRLQEIERRAKRKRYPTRAQWEEALLDAHEDRKALLASHRVLTSELETLRPALDRAARIINWMAPYIGKMATPDGAFAELNEH